VQKFFGSFFQKRTSSFLTEIVSAPISDALEYGRELIPLVREQVARRKAAIAA
jgi:hypothetical protein